MRKAWDSRFDQNDDMISTVISWRFGGFLWEMHQDMCAKLTSQLSLVVDPPASKAAVVKKSIAEGALVLVPVTPLVGCSTLKKRPQNVLDLGEAACINDTHIHAFAQPVHRLGKDAVSVKDARGADATAEMFVPFWLVQPTAKSSEVNMHFEVIPKHVSGNRWDSGAYNITVLVNSKALEEGDVLKYAQVKDQKYPPQSDAKKRKV